jgi:hypothetical protein
VERSYDCASFQKIATVPYAPAAGTNSYRFEDNTHNSGMACYRIKQVDNDERFMYSYVVAVMLELLDLKGKKLFQKTMLLRPQENRLALELAGLAPGMYIIKIATLKQIYYQKLIVE